MARNTVVVSVLADTKQFANAMGGTDSTFKKFAKGAAIVATAAAGIVTAVGVKAVKSASELEQAMGGMEAVFKDSAGQMKEWASEAASSVGLAKSEYAQLSTVLGAQLKNMGVPMSELAGQTNDLVGLGADLAAQFGGSTSEAVSALSSLLRGERDPIERYGVSINEAAVKAQMAEMGLNGLSGEAEKNAKLTATLALLYGQTADAQGAFARESTTLAGAQQRLSAGTENLYATLGTALLPAVTAVTAGLGELVNRMQSSEWFAAFTENITGASNAFADFIFGILNGEQTIDFAGLLAGLLPAITTGIQNAAAWLAGGGLEPILASIAAGRDGLLQAGITLFTSLAQALPQILPALMQAVLTFVQDLVNLLVTSAPAILAAGVQVFTSLIQSLAVVIPQLVTALLAMLPGLIESLLSMVPMLLEAATQLFTALVQAIPVILPPLIEAIVTTLPMLVDTILGMLPDILDAAVGLFTALVDALPIILPTLIIGIINLIPRLVTTIIGMVPRLITAGVRLFTGLVTAVPKMIPNLISALIRMAPQLVRAIISMIPQLVNAGRDLVLGLANGLWNASGAVVDNLLGIAQNAIGAFKSFFGIQSPSRLMAEMGMFIDRGLAGGIDRGLRHVRTAVRGLNGAVTDEFNADLTTGQLTVSRTGSASTAADAAVQRVYNITIQAVAASAEVGRAVVDAINAYERTTTTRAPGGLG